MDEQTLAVSQENARKLDHIVQLLNGEENAPGVIGRTSIIENVLWGKDKSGGLVQQHAIMWRVHVWLLCTGSALLGFLAKWGVDKFNITAK